MRYWQVFPGVWVIGLQFVWPAAAQTRVACVGDSITEGYGLASPANDAYPAQLQSVLGSDYDVRNFGVSGTTASKQGDKPYWNQAAYTQSTTFDPNVVLIMLGTNDAKPQNWDATAFRTDYTALVAQYRGLGARVLLATPPKVFGAGAFDISPSTVADVLVPLVRELAPQVEAELVDIFLVTQDHSEWFPDTVHPSRDGATALANAFAAAVQNPQQPETGATTSTAATETGPGAPNSEDPPSPSSAASDSSPLQETGDSPTSATTVSATSSSAFGATSSAPISDPVPTTAVVPSPTPPTSAIAAPVTSPTATTGATSNAPTSTEQTSSAAPVSAADSGCTVSGNNARARLTGGTALGLALAALGLRRKRREFSRTAWASPTASSRRAYRRPLVPR